MPRLAAVLVLPALLGAAALDPAQAGTVAGGPVLAQNFPDPDVVKVGDTYHAYATSTTGRNVQHATSRDLLHWTVGTEDVLPVLGSWVGEPEHRVWAPDVFAHDGGFTLHYTAHDRASGRQCIGAAVAAAPSGPFRPVGDGPLVCPAEDGGAIDAAGYAEGGRRYMLWKSDGNCCGKDTWLHLQPVSADGTRTTGPAVRLFRQELPWEGAIVEAPTLVRRDGRYVLFYPAGSYGADGYATGYATADALAGPYTKGPEPLLTTDSLAGAVRGPGGQDVVTGPDGRDRILFHGWDADHGRRFLYAADLGFADGRPVVRGSRVRHQAEDARVHRALVRDARGAWGGRAVGHIDHADSSVEFRVFAASAGPHTLAVRYGNGSLGEGGAPLAASHDLWVNGEDRGAVRYPYTGWDDWRTVERPVVLREGWNTLRLAKGLHYTELDAVEVG
ncbi:family 43 glycosylhydrolase [Streptomyces sp. CC228A]|uniref:family 43 glycosylhydrolase n=1 Tax=Streptomyces sp. CC228A TaxID=2898186 RepID=UPI001F189CD8|nr:family 43 glycosylhydrolase [Streptomyces sp. CC228A]